MNENSNSNNEIEKRDSIEEDIKKYINNNIISLSPNKNYNNIIEISIGDSKKKITQLGLEKKIFSKFNIKYIIKYNCRKSYNDLIMYSLLFNKNTHLVSVFKDYMIYDYVDEFFKRYYTYPETLKRLPSFSVFYKNYLTFFCQPCFTNFKYNNLIQRNREKKAELFYNKNFRDKNKESIEDEGIIEDSEEEEEDYGVGKTIIEKTIFNETVKKNIEKNSPINSSMALPESETKLKSDESGLLTSFDNQSSLRNILKYMKIIKKITNKKGEELSEIKKNKNLAKMFDVEDKANDKISNQNQRNTNKQRLIKGKNNEIEQKDINKFNMNNNKKETYKIKDFKEIKVGKIKMNIKNINKKKNEKSNNINYHNKIKSDVKSEQNEKINNLSNKKVIKDEKDSLQKENEKKNVYIKKIELIKFSKARSNSNRNSNLKEKMKFNQIDNDKNKNLRINHSQNIINILKNIKNLDKNKKIQNEGKKHKQNKQKENSTKLKKNFSEKVLNKNNKLNINTNVNIGKKYFTRNKDKNKDNLGIEKNEEISNNNGSKNNNIKTYYNIYQRKTVSKSKKESKLNEEIGDLKTRSDIPQQHKNEYNFCPLDNTKNPSINNISIKDYKNMIRSRNNNHNYNNSSCTMNNNSTNNNKMTNKNRINSNLKSMHKNSTYHSKNNSRQKTYNFMKKQNNTRGKNRSNRLNLNLLKTQNVEVILNQIKMLKPKIIGKKSTQKNSESQRIKLENSRKMNFISFENINIHNNTNINYNNKINQIDNYNKKNTNKIYTKLIKKNNFNTTNKINICPKYNNNLRYNKLKGSASEYELYHLKLDLNKKSNSLKNLKKQNGNNILFNSNNEINNINIINNKKNFHSNLQNFKRNVPPRQIKDDKGKTKVSYKQTKINSINNIFNPKISCDSSNIKGMNYTNIINNTNSNKSQNNNTFTPINKEEKLLNKDLSKYFLDSNYQNKTFFNEENQQYSPLKHIHNVNININNQININNNDIININDNKSSILISKNIQLPKNKNKKSGKKDNTMIKNNKKILLSRNKQNSLDFNSLNSFLSVNSNYKNLKKNCLIKKNNPLSILASSNNFNIGEAKKTTIYLQNYKKNKVNKNSYYKSSYNNSNERNYSSNIILFENKKGNNNNINKKKEIKSINPSNKKIIKFKNNKPNNNYNNNANKKFNNQINNENKSNDRKIMKKSSTYQILPK